MFRKLIYKIKHAIQNNTGLYRLVYNLVTFNFDYFKQQLQADKYPSKFGGMWTDRSDFDNRLNSKLKDNILNENDLALINEWREKGRILIKNAISHELIDAYLNEIEELKSQQPSKLLITAANLPEPTIYSPENLAENQSVRIVDDYFFSECSRQLLFHRSITRFMQLVFERKPVLTQSLRFEYGSQQAIHQDTAFVRMNAPMKLAAIWLALEDIKPGSGELIYYPGSHRWEGYLFSGQFKHYDAERDGPEQLNAWHQWIHDEAKRRHVDTESFVAKKGDILIWHAALAHGGSQVIDKKQTRLSLVGHYCPQGVRPLYQYYKPAQRKFYDYSGYKFSSSYYLL